ncbi:UNVERIFIED_ORG: hypothetical protein JN05_05417 [Zoogloea ramigera]|uniref:Nucleotidyl transferase AbiEii/AbiGii toxin family protein n=1 Tax=Duganella zoogloeoides TaxID=75659 RepID=A0ABZ0XY47_9BURK|nr:hypothetical protein [Duganella zoogloeoides]WQH04508.1 hypothetical protein SR858_26310 [Duganella zoogloeoides]
MATIALSSTSVRALKNALLDRFPSVKSAHLSEAIAATAGFRTHAALLSHLQQFVDEPVVVLEDKPFLQRLKELGYPEILNFELSSVWNDGTGVPEEVRELIVRLLKLEENPEGRYPEIYSLRRQCSKLFAKAFGIGQLEPLDKDRLMVKSFSRGVDHKAAQPGWGKHINTHNPSLDFPGTDHQVRFYERLPLSGGRYVEYSTALVSMPYTQSFKIPELPRAKALAETLGWQYMELEQWSWYAASKTTLILYRRTTTHQEMLQMWSTSFKRWLIENRSRLNKGASQDRRNVIEDAIDCQHLPLGVETWEELREQYFKEFAPSMYYSEDSPTARTFKKIFEKWLSERGTEAAKIQ